MARIPAKSLRQLSLQVNPTVFTPFWEFYRRLWTDSGLEQRLLELVRIHSATIVGCKH